MVAACQDGSSDNFLESTLRLAAMQLDPGPCIMLPQPVAQSYCEASWLLVDTEAVRLAASERKVLCTFLSADHGAIPV